MQSFATSTSHIVLRTATWFVGVLGACTAITGLYVVVFDSTTIPPLLLTLIAAPAHLVAIIKAIRTNQKFDLVANESRGCFLALFAGCVGLASVIFALVPMTARVLAYVPLAGIAALFALAASLLWGKPRPTTS